MKLHFLTLALILGLLLFAAGCVMPGNVPVWGSIVTSNVMGPVAVGDPAVQASKVGMAEAVGYFVFSSGDASIEAAMKNGDIRRIHHVDCKVFSILGLYARYQSLVYGE